MRHSWKVLAVVGLLLAGPGLAAQKNAPVAKDQTYTIKIKREPAVGKSVVVRDSEKTTGSVKISSEGKLLQEQKPNDSKEEVYTKVVLEKGKKYPKKFQRIYKKAVLSMGGKSKPRSYQERTVIFELKEGKYQATVEGEPALSRKDLAALVEDAPDPDKPDMEEVFLPKGPVKVNHAWEMDTGLLAKGFAKIGKLDTAKIKGKAKLVKVYKKGSKQFGVIEFEVNLAVKSMKGLSFETPATFDIKGTVDTAIDGSSTAAVLKMTGKLTGTSTVQQEDMKIKVELNIEMSGTKERSEEK
jgi:hypothetical protein